MNQLLPLVKKPGCSNRYRMRYSIPLMISLLLLIAHVSSAAYAQQVTINSKRTPLKNVLNMIQQQSGYSLLYNAAEIDGDKKINIRINNASVEDAVKESLRGTSLTYTIKNKIIVIKRKNDPKMVNVYAQTISGKVTDAAGAPLVGATVSLSGIKIATSTNELGEFVLNNVPEGTYTLSVTYVGFEAYSETVVVSNSPISKNITLTQSIAEEDNIVVTALGIKRSEKALTYNVQKVDGNAVNTVKDPSFVNALTGKIAGLTLTHSSAPGGSTKAVLRGNKSINGNNNALYVVDGIPLPSMASATTSNGFQLTDGGDGISNLNPDDIAEISVLSGASAAALYGGQAANGVILITTKKGMSGKTSVNLTSSATFDQPFILPKFQNTYGALNEGDFSGWGKKAQTGSSYSPKDFFNTGKTFANALSISGGTDKSQTYFSVASTNAKGIVPNNSLDRYNISLRNVTKFFNDKLTLDGRAEYTYQDLLNMPGQGTYFNPLTAVYLFPSASEDFNQYKAFEKYDELRKINVQNWPSDYFINDLVLQNPYWVTNRNLFETERNRFAGSVTAKYDLSEYFNIQGRVKIDRATDFGTQKLYATTIPVLAGSSGNGYYREINYINRQTYGDLLLNYNRTFDNFSINAVLGTSITDNKLRTSSVGGSLDQYKIPNFFSLNNINPIAVLIDPDYRYQNQAVFFSGTFGFKDYLYLDVTGRNDWNSTLPKPFFYPSVGLSAILSNMVQLPQAISFAKIRLSYAEVGNAIDPKYAYAAAPATYPISTSGIQLSKGFPLGDNLKPEMTKSFEIGTDLRFINKINFTATYYYTKTFNQFFRLTAPSSTGYSYYDFNGGQVNNQGVEASLGYNGLFGDFSWRPTLNFSFNKNKVVSLLTYTDPVNQSSITVDSVVLGGNTYVRKGHSYGDIGLFDFERDGNGNVKLNDAGLPVFSKNLIYVGNINPKFQLSFNNEFGFKNFLLGFLIDGRFGGKVISATEMKLDNYGMSERTAQIRDNGGMEFNGADITKNYYQTISSQLSPSYVYDATNIRLRELSFGYNIPAKAFNNKIHGIQLSVIGRNLWMIQNKAPFDPDVITLTGNEFQGYEYFSSPSLQSLGFSLKVNL